MKFVKLVGLALILSGLVACGGLGSQESVGHVSGVVGRSPAGPLDNRVLPEPNVTVEFVLAPSGKASDVQTDSQGKFAIDLAAGSYDVRLKGFSPSQLYYGRRPDSYGQWPHVTVAPGQPATVDLILDSGIR